MQTGRHTGGEGKTAAIVLCTRLTPTRISGLFARRLEGEEAVNLSDSECRDLMDAAWGAIKPWWGRRESTITWVEEDGSERPMTIYPMGLLPEAPEEIKRLGGVYDSIVSGGALAVDPDADGNYEHAENALPAIREAMRFGDDSP